MSALVNLLPQLRELFAYNRIVCVSKTRTVTYAFRWFLFFADISFECAKRDPHKRRKGNVWLIQVRSFGRRPFVPHRNTLCSFTCCRFAFHFVVLREHVGTLMFPFFQTSHPNIQSSGLESRKSKSARNCTPTAQLLGLIHV